MEEEADFTIVSDFLSVPALIFNLQYDNQVIAIVNLIKLNEFKKQNRAFVMHSLDYSIHHCLTEYSVSYSYTLNAKHSTYDPPIHDIHIHIPEYTPINITYKQREELLAKPPDNKRKLVIKPSRAKRRKATNKEDASTKITVFTAYTEV